MPRRFPSTAGLLAFLTLTAACDPLASVAVRQALQPAPSSSCVASALAASPRVIRVMPSRPTRTEDHFGVFLRDSAARGGRLAAGVTYRAGRGTGQDTVPALEVKFGWIGTLTQYSDEEKRHMTSVGRELLAELRAACAAEAAGSVECREQGIGRDRSRGCAPA